MQTAIQLKNDDLWSDSEEAEKRIELALEAGVRNALRLHRQKGVPIAVWQDGQVVIVAPEQIEVPDDDSDLLAAFHNGTAHNHSNGIE